MIFLTAESAAEKILQSGFWKPVFKRRQIIFNDNITNANYDSKLLDPNYDNNLRKKLFGDNDYDILVLENKYPFVMETDYIQIVIWIRDNTDPGIHRIEQIISKSYPKYDYLITLNQDKYRSIKTILHYHAILKLRTIPSPINPKLNKLVVYHRHSNREPILRFDMQPKVNHKLIKLTSLGITNAQQFALQLKNIYLPHNEELFNNVKLLSSPILRCEQTLTEIANTLNLSQKIEYWNNLFYQNVHSEQVTVNNLPEIKELNRKYIPLIKKLCQTFNIHYESYPLFIYEIYSSVICYKELHNLQIDSKLEQELANATLDVLNIIIDKLTTSHHMKIFLDKLNDPESLILCSTHDTLVFALGKYLQRINNNSNYLELPNYLSNIRFEFWSDNTIRLYYDNYYLGSKIN